MNINDVADIAYLAGYFDGEGTVVIAKAIYESKKHGSKSYHTLRIQVVSTDIVSLKEFERVLGGYVQFHKSTHPGRWKPRWDWCCCADEATAALQRMLPYLRVKRHDAEVGIEFQRLMSAGLGDKRLTEEMQVEREGLRLRLVAAHGLSSRSKSIVGHGRPAGIVESQPRRTQKTRQSPAEQAG